MSDGKVLIETKMEKGDIDKSLNDIEKRVQDAGKNMQNAGKTLSKNVTAPILAVSGAVGKLALSLGDYADEILDTASATGMSTDAIQEWNHVAEVMNVSGDAVTDAMGRLNRQWSGIRDGSNSSANAIQELGLNLDELDKLNSDQRMDAIVGALSDVDDESRRAEIGSELFSRRWEEIAPIVDEGSDSLDDLRNSYDGVMTKEDLEKADEMREAWVKFKSQIAVAGQEIALSLVPIFTDLLLPAIEGMILPAVDNLSDRISNLIDWFMDLSPEVQKIIGLAVGFATALGPAIYLAGKLTTSVGKLMNAIKLLGLPKLIIIGIIVALMKVLYDLYQENEVFRERVIEIWNGISNFFEEVWEQIKNIFFTALALIQEFWDEWGEDIYEFIFELFMTITDFLMETFEKIREIIYTALEWIQEFWNEWGEEIWEMIHYLFTELWEFLKETWDAIMETFELALEFIKELISYWTEWFQEFWDEWGETIMSIWERMWEFIQDYLVTAWELIQDVISTAISIVQDIIEVFIAVVTGDWERFWNAILNLVTNILGLVQSVISSTFETIQNLISTIFGAIFDITKNIWNNILGSITGFVDSIWTRINDTFHSIREFINNMWGAVRRNTDSFRSSMVSIIKRLRRGLKAPFNGIIGFANSVIGAFERMVNAIANAINRIPSFSVPSWVPGIGGNTFGLPRIPRASLPRIPSLDTGTNYVPQDMLTYVHQGEAVIPKKYNPAVTGANNSTHIEIKGNNFKSRSDIDYLVNEIDRVKI